MYQEYAKHIGADEFVLRWVETTLAKHIKGVEPSTEEVEHILDYLVRSGQKVSKMSYDEAKSATEKWTEVQRKKGAAIQESVSDTETVLDFGDGFRVVKLVGENAYKREGYLMCHCVASYYGKKIEVYSLRDKDNMPHCTMEKNQQIKGKGNGDIHPKYIGYVVAFLKHIGMSVSDSEMLHLGYISVEKFKDELGKETTAKLFSGKYLRKNEKLVDKEGNEFASLDLLEQIPLITDFENKLKISFELPAFVKLSVEYLLRKVKVKDGDNAASGRYSQLAASGDSSRLAASGRYSQLAASGDFSQLAASGDSSQLAASGDSSKIEIHGEGSVGANIGIMGIIKGRKGNWVTLAEYDENFAPICVKSAKIDGKKLKEDIWYKLQKGRFVEAEVS